MITAYHQPNSLDEALELLALPDARPMGGGTVLSRSTPVPIQIVDLHALDLGEIKVEGDQLIIGATASLQEVYEHPASHPALKKALQLEAPVNTRNAATVAGALVTADGRSPFAAVLLALDTQVHIACRGEQRKPPAAESLALGEFLPFRDEWRAGTLVTGISIPRKPALAFEGVARTPADKPIVCAALAKWPSGRTRLALGGYGPAPLLALDGTETGGLPVAARNAFHEAFDAWASAEYRMHAAGILAERCLRRVEA